MIKFIVSLLLQALLAFTLGLVLPWWSIVPACFIVALAIPQRPFPAFLSGFLALFLLWGGLAFFIDLNNQHILSARVAALFKLGSATYILILLTGCIGGLVAGLTGLTGSFARRVNG